MERGKKKTQLNIVENTTETEDTHIQNFLYTQ